MRKIEPPTILSVASKLLTIQVSDNPEDYPKTMPKWVLRMIESHNNKQRDWALELKRIDEELKKEKAK